MHHFTRHVQLNYVNLMTDDHYTRLRGFMNPWRAAATVLHAHHVSTEDTLALKVMDVTPDGDIPRLGINFPSESRVLLAAQRWHQLLTQEADPPLFKEKPHPLRTGIRALTHQLDLHGWKRPRVHGALDAIPAALTGTGLRLHRSNGSVKVTAADPTDKRLKQALGQVRNLGLGVNVADRMASNSTRVAVGALKTMGCIALNDEGVFEETDDLRLALPGL